MFGHNHVHGIHVEVVHILGMESCLCCFVGVVALERPAVLMVLTVRRGGSNTSQDQVISCVNCGRPMAEPLSSEKKRRLAEAWTVVIVLFAFALLAGQYGASPKPSAKKKKAREKYVS